MEIRLKRVPFNVELAKKITEGKIKGAKIITDLYHAARILAFDIKGDYHIAVAIEDDSLGELVYEFDSNGVTYNTEERLQLYVPTNYNSYSNFTPQKWQPCLVRDFTDETWIVRVATGKVVNGYFTFYNDEGNTDIFNITLPISKLTIKLLGTNKSYEELLEEKWTSEE